VNRSLINLIIHSITKDKQKEVTNNNENKSFIIDCPTSESALSHVKVIFFNRKISSSFFVLE